MCYMKNIKLSDRLFLMDNGTALHATKTQQQKNAGERLRAYQLCTSYASSVLMRSLSWLEKPVVQDVKKRILDKVLISEVRVILQHLTIHLVPQQSHVNFAAVELEFSCIKRRPNWLVFWA